MGLRAVALALFLIAVCYVVMQKIIERGGKKAAAPAPIAVPEHGH